MNSLTCEVFFKLYMVQNFLNEESKFSTFIDVGLAKPVWDDFI